jgi:hypothetical protein
MATTAVLVDQVGLLVGMGVDLGTAAGPAGRVAMVVVLVAMAVVPVALVATAEGLVDLAATAVVVATASRVVGRDRMKKYQ